MLTDLFLLGVAFVLFTSIRTMILGPQILPLENDDLYKIDALQPEDWPDILPQHQFYLTQNFCYPFKVVCDNTIVGLGTYILFGNTAWLAHIIVHSRFRRRGIGQQIIEYLLKKVPALNNGSILLIATAMGETLYRSAGFRDDCDYIGFERVEQSHRENQNVLESEPFSEKYTNQLLHLDKIITGEDRRNILRGHLPEARLLLQKDILKGYFLPTLGEGTILAIEEEAGIALMKEKFKTAVKAVLPQSCKAGRKWLLENGFQQTRTLKRMVIGQNLNWKPEFIFTRIGGNFG